MRRIGILGGMGPEATLLLMTRLLAAVPARDDADHVPLVVHQNPQVPSRIEHLIEGGGPSPTPVLVGMARDLEAAGAAALAMPCMTAHAYLDAVRAATPLPVIDMLAETVAALAAAAPGGRVGMLASPAVHRAGLFEGPMAAAGLTPLWPVDEAPVLAAIRSVKAGGRPEAAFARIGEGLAGQGADILCVACTELSLLTGALAPAPPWCDALDCLVAAIVRAARG